MTHLAGTTLLGLVGEDGDLLTLSVLKNDTLNLCVNVRSTYFKISVVVANCNNLIEYYSFFCGCIELFDEDNVAALNTVLLTAGFDDCVHFSGTCLNSRLATVGGKIHLNPQYAALILYYKSPEMSSIIFPLY